MDHGLGIILRPTYDIADGHPSRWEERTQEAGRRSYGATNLGRPFCGGDRPSTARYLEQVLLAISTFGHIVRLVVGLVVAVITTFISLRMLGVRRGWLQALLAGVTGWVIAAIVSAGLNDWHWTADSFLAVTIVIAIPTTMALMLLLDLFAPPGSLARGSRAGLVAVPKPGRVFRQQVEPFTRYRELLGIMHRHGFGPAVGHKSRSDDDEVHAAAPVEVRLREALEEAGGVFVKLGQIAATRIDLLPPQICAELSRLQSRSTPVPADDVRKVLEEELGRPVEQIFASFEWTPLAAASIAQTHTAVLVTGESVVVKVQRPAIDQTMKRDLAALNQLARLAERRTELGQDLQVSQLAKEFGRSLRSELNFLEETNNTDEMRIVVSDGSDIRVPEVFREYCTRRVVVEERLWGTPLSEVDALDGVDRSALARELLRVNIDHILRRGVFHADPHPGNIMVLDDGGLGMIDFGATGRLDGIQQQAVVDMLIALVKRDYRLLSDGLERVADVGAHISRQKLDRSLAQLLAKYTRPNGVVDTAALADLVPLLSSYPDRAAGRSGGSVPGADHARRNARRSLAGILRDRGRHGARSGADGRRGRRPERDGPEGAHRRAPGAPTPSQRRRSIADPALSRRAAGPDRGERGQRPLPANTGQPGGPGVRRWRPGAVVGPADGRRGGTSHR